jgi:hypothetical protein
MFNFENWYCLVDESAYLWVKTVLLFSPTCSFILFEAGFIQGLLKKNKKKLARSINLTLHYIDDVLSLNNFGDFDTTDTTRFA